MASITPTCCWSDLTCDLLEKIVNCHKSSRLYIIRFRGVFRQWRSSLPLPPTYPSSPKLPFPMAPDFTVPDKLILMESTICSIQLLSQTTSSTSTTTTPPCLVRIQHSESGNAIVQNLLCNPLPNDWNTSRPFFLMMDLLDFRVSEICNDHLLDQVVPPTRKVAVASGFSKIGEGFTVMAVISGKLLAWRMEDDKWTSIFDHAFFLKVSYIRGKFYAIGYGGLAITVDPDSLKTTQLAHERQGCPFDILSYVVVSCGDILGVFVGGSIISIQVGKLDEEKHLWVKAGDELKNRIAFIGINYSFSVLAKDFPGYKANSIYFDNTYPNFAESPVCGHPGSTVVVYEMEKGFGSELCDQCDCPLLLWRPLIKQQPCWVSGGESFGLTNQGVRVKKPRVAIPDLVI
ncbi:hypothetical protein Tsubulata_015591 [Turnera subulata]|uniref:KIB1-4 beta-propeller domain-containing protein n=1 Tax=Turnera subulata TaxID=218843 RepID=A0A9Q0FHZ9_9ROSI|nr:hypothetical protein Tsubulata_015591 [Turnera subulata]